MAIKKSLLAAFLVLYSFPALAQGFEIPKGMLPQKEDPESIFSSQLGDDEVELYAEGFWEMELLSKGSWSSATGVFKPEYLLFSQRPDLYALLMFRKEWYFEAWVSDEISNAFFELGYENIDDGWLKRVRLGNREIGIPGFPFFPLGEPESELGIVFNAGDDETGSSFDAMLRWDGLLWRSEKFSGLSARSETAIDAALWLGAQAFVLPGINLSRLEVFTESQDGTIRQLSPAEYSFSYSDSLLFLEKAASHKVHASYLDDGNPVEFTLFEAGQPSLYEAKNLYQLKVTDSSRLFLRNNGNMREEETIRVVEIFPGYIILRRWPEPGPGDILFREPLRELAPWAYERDDKNLPITMSSGFSILSASIESIESLKIDRRAVKGTVTVYRDGLASHSFVHNPDTGIVELTPSPGAGEKIEIHYAVKSDNRSDGALTMAAVLGMPFGSWDTGLAIAARWPLPGQGLEASSEALPAWAGLGLWARDGGQNYSMDFGLSGRYDQAVSGGHYLIMSMDEENSLPFFLSPGSDIGFEATRNEEENSLEISIMGSGSGKLIQYIPEPPLEVFEELHFFIRIDEPAQAAPSLTLALGEMLIIHIDDMEYLPTGSWILARAKLMDGAGLVLEDEDGLYHSASGRVEYNPAGRAGSISISLGGEDLRIQIGRIYLTGSRKGFSLINRNGLKYWTEILALSLDTDAILAESSSLAARGRAEWKHEALKLSLDATPFWSRDYAEMGLGYGIYLGSTVAGIKEEYSSGLNRRGFAHTSGLSLKIGSTSLALNLAANQSGIDGVDDAALPPGEDLLRKWGFTFEQKGIIKLEGAFSSTGAGPDGNAPAGVENWLSFWLASWQAYWPGTFTPDSARSIQYKLSIPMDLLSLSTSSRSGVDRSGNTSFSAVTAYTFETGGMKLKPWYRRNTVLESQGIANSVLSEHLNLRDGWLEACPYWVDYPLIDIIPGWKSPVPDSPYFSHKTALGIDFSRPLGFGMLDFFLPYRSSVSWERDRQKKLDSYSDTALLGINVKMASVNIFGARGIEPVIQSIDYDEYRVEADLRLSEIGSGQKPLFAMETIHGARLELAQKSIFNFENSLSIKEERAGTRWNDRLKLRLSIGRDGSWLGSLMALLTGEREAEKPEGEKHSVSEWWERIKLAEPELEDVFGLSLKAGHDQRGWNYGMEARYTSTYRLAKSVFVSAWFETGFDKQPPLEWLISYSLGVQGRIQF